MPMTRCRGFRVDVVELVDGLGIIRVAVVVGVDEAKIQKADGWLLMLFKVAVAAELEGTSGAEQAL
jgi:hypothetical protein